MNSKELMLWVIGMQDCAEGLPARSSREDYLAGYGIQYSIETNGVQGV
jgi:hypothetical protein